jgi:hypothetical protein
MNTAISEAAKVIEGSLDKLHEELMVAQADIKLLSQYVHDLRSELDALKAAK